MGQPTTVFMVMRYHLRIKLAVRGGVGLIDKVKGSLTKPCQFSRENPISRDSSDPRSLESDDTVAVTSVSSVDLSSLFTSMSRSGGYNIKL